MQGIIDELRADGTIPPSAQVEIGGVLAQQAEAFSGLFAAMGVAILLVYLMMVLAFNSLVTPFIILFSLPLATIGAFPALLLTGLRPGSALAIDRDCYRGVRRLAEAHLEPRGVELRLTAPAELASALQGADMVWLESPSNPKLDVYDLEALAETARAAGALSVLDNTTAGPLLQKGLDLGVDAVLTSATKHLSGHSDLMLGYALAFGGLLLLGGRLGDLYGRRRIFATGLTVFAIASLIGGFAQNEAMLLGSRALQGLGAAERALRPVLDAWEAN